LFFLNPQTTHSLRKVNLTLKYTSQWGVKVWVSEISFWVLYSSQLKNPYCQPFSDLTIWNFKLVSLAQIRQLRRRVEFGSNTQRRSQGVFEPNSLMPRQGSFNVYTPPGFISSVNLDVRQ
jgi:hypothetical protein